MVNLAAVAAVSKSLNLNQGRASGPCASCAFCGKSCICFSIKEPEAASMSFMVNLKNGVGSRVLMLFC
jgi:DTW domain-containing protein YfiP